MGCSVLSLLVEYLWLLLLKILLLRCIIWLKNRLLLLKVCLCLHNFLSLLAPLGLLGSWVVLVLLVLVIIAPSVYWYWSVDRIYLVWLLIVVACWNDWDLLEGHLVRGNLLLLNIRLVMSLVIRLYRFIKPRTLLIGESEHAINPISHKVNCKGCDSLELD